ncbi:MAG: hypothetical protein ACRDJP_10595, partial [Actinomycetota bacterium]
MSEMAPSAVTIEQLRGSSRRRRRERVIRSLFLGSAALALVVNAAILASLLDGAVDFLSKLGEGPGFGSLLSSHGWFPRRGFFDVRTITVGTLMISLVAMVVATPLGLGAAMYLS